MISNGKIIGVILGMIYGVVVYNVRGQTDDITYEWVVTKISRVQNINMVNLIIFPLMISCKHLKLIPASTSQCLHFKDHYKSTTLMDLNT